MPARVSETGGKVTSYSLSVRIEHPRREERAQVFNEAWRTMRDRFYDGTFKGLTWESIRDKYAELAASRATLEELPGPQRASRGRLCVLPSAPRPHPSAAGPIRRKIVERLTGHHGQRWHWFLWAWVRTLRRPGARWFCST